MSVEVIMPKGMLGASDSDTSLDAAMRAIGVSASKDPDCEWADKYGTTEDNEVFMMHPFCWCERDDCLWCGGENVPGSDNDQVGAPNFWYKPLDFKVWWYKYIGRSMETNKQLSAIELYDMVAHCLRKIHDTQNGQNKTNN